MAVEGFSDVPGFRLRDFDVACPSGGLCPAMEKVVHEYVGDVGTEGVEPDFSLRDMVLIPILTGYRSTVEAKGCDGAEAGPCPALIEMKQDPVKRTVIGAMKRIFIGREN